MGGHRLLPGRRRGDRHVRLARRRVRRRRVFQLGLALFVASCVLIGLSTPAARDRRPVHPGRGRSTILACGLSLLTVANSGQEQLRAVSLWGAAAAVGRRGRAAGRWGAGRLTGWQGLFWIDAVVAAGLHGDHPPHRDGVQGPETGRARSTTPALVLIALTLGPLILALSKGSDWGWASAATIGCLVVAVAAGFAFVVVEKRSPVPLLDLGLLRNRVLVGSTVAILIGAGTINALMYVLSLYFQDPSTPRLHRRCRPGWPPCRPPSAWSSSPPACRGSPPGSAAARIGLGFAITAAGFAADRSRRADWRYGAFVLPLVAIAVGMGMSNGPASSASTACVPVDQVGSASGVSNMARYVGYCERGRGCRTDPPR